MFSCGSQAGGDCWCSGLPPLMSPSPSADCLCPTCLKDALARQVERSRPGDG
jgi:hypothetical protein